MKKLVLLCVITIVGLTILSGCRTTKLTKQSTESALRAKEVEKSSEDSVYKRTVNELTEKWRQMQLRMQELAEVEVTEQITQEVLPDGTQRTVTDRQMKSRTNRQAEERSFGGERKEMESADTTSVKKSKDRVIDVLQNVKHAQSEDVRKDIPVVWWVILGLGVVFVVGVAVRYYK